MSTETRPVPVPSEQGCYQQFYAEFAAALRGEMEFPVPAPRAAD